MWHMGWLRLVILLRLVGVSLRYYASQYAVYKKLAYITSLIAKCLIFNFVGDCFYWVLMVDSFKVGRDRFVQLSCICKQYYKNVILLTKRVF
jgi:hypothetical protein